MKKGLKIGLILAAVAIIATVIYYFFIRPAMLLKEVSSAAEPEDAQAFKDISAVVQKDEFAKNGLPAWVINLVVSERGKSKYGTGYTDALMSVLDSAVYVDGGKGITDAVHSEAWSIYNNYRDKAAQKLLP